MPALSYYQTIESGYQALGFSEEILQSAVLKSIKEMSLRQTEETEAVCEQQLE